MAKRHSARDLPEAVRREVHIHRSAGIGLARVFFREYKQSPAGSSRVAFRFVDVVHFFALAAASGVVGNLAYGSLATAVRAVRKPKREIISGGVRFEAVVSRKTYNRLRRQRHPRATASRASSIIEDKLGTRYELMVTLKRARPPKLRATRTKTVNDRNWPEN
jgi:hypothetical protein